MRRLLFVLSVFGALAIASAAAVSGTSAITVVKASNLHSWVVDTTALGNTAVPYDFNGPADTIGGTGSFEFGPIGPAAAPKQEMQPPEVNQLASDFGGFQYDFQVLANAAVGESAKQLYTNVYVDSAANGVGTLATFYDCRYLFWPTSHVSGWNTFSFDGSTVAVDAHPANGTVTCPTSLGALPAGSTMLFFRLNGGDTSSNDNGLKAAFDNIQVTFAGNTTTYNFEPETACTTDCYVDGTNGNDSFGGDTPSSAKKTIGAGVDAVSSGGTVHVAAGTYNVTKLHITKPLTLLGAGAATTVIDGGQAVLAASDYGTIYVDGVSGGGVTIKGFTLKNAGAPSDDPEPMLVVVAGNAADAPIDVEDNHFIGVGGDTFDIGFWQYSGDGKVTFKNNELNGMWQGMLLERPRGGASVTGNNFHDLVTAFSDPTLYEPEGVFAFSYSGDNISALLDLSGNSFSGYSGDSIVLEGGYSGHDPAKFSDVKIDNNSINAIGAGSERRHVGVGLINYSGTGAQGGAPNAEIMGNTITGTDTSNDSIGVWLDGPSDGVQIKNNFINGVNAGVKSTDSLGDGYFTANAVVNDNDLSGNAKAVNNGSSSATIDASGNWWGSSAESNVSAAASGAVDFTPFLDTGTDADTGTAGFQGSLNTLHVTALGAQVGATGRIQEGINDVTGSSVIVGAGTFQENVVLNKKLTLEGAGATTIIQPSASGPGISITAGGAVNDPLIIKDLKVTGALGGNNTGSGLSITAAVSHIKIDSVESSSNTGHGLAVNVTGVVNDLDLESVNFSNNGSAGNGDGLRIPTSLTSMNGLTINSSHLDNNVLAGMEIYGPPATGSVTNVNVTDTTFSGDTLKGIYAERLDTATFDGITVNGSGTTGSFAAGIDINLKKQAFTNITIKNSSITNSGTGDTTNGVGITIKSRDDGTNGPTSLSGVTLTGNTITGNQYGLRLGETTKNNVGPTTVHVNRNNISGNVSGHGVINVTQTTDDVSCNWWGSANGPSGSGPGTGNSVSTGLTFVPWLASSALDGDCTAISVGADAGNATGTEGGTISTSGSFTGDIASMTIAGDTLSGTFTPNVGAGTWTWSYATTDNFSAVSITVTGHGTNGSTADDSFDASASNANPTATGVTAPASHAYGTNFSISLAGPPTDVSSVDAGSLHYAFDCGSGYSATDYAGASSTNSASCPAPAQAHAGQSITVKGKVFDKDGGSNEYTTSVEILQPEITLTPALKHYGTQQTGTSSASTTYTVKNVGTQNLSISSVAIAGTNPSSFPIDTNNCDAQSLGHNATCTILVYFHPTTDGFKSARLEVGSNDPNSATSVSNLDGTGAPASQGTVTIKLDARPNGAQSFSFSGNNGIGAFSLVDNGTSSNTASFSENAGSYTISLTQVSGWALKSLTCDASETINTANRSVTINLASGQNVSCTFTETKRLGDESIALNNAGPYAGVGIYASTVQPSQTQNMAIKKGKLFNFYVHLKNNGQDSDTYNVFSTLNGSTAYKVKFFNGSTDITARVNAGTYRLTLGAGAQATIRIKVTCKASSATATRNIDLTMKSLTSTSLDVVRAHATRA
jgi:hypothetical protein